MPASLAEDLRWSSSPLCSSSLVLLQRTKLPFLAVPWSSTAQWCVSSVTVSGCFFKGFWKDELQSALTFWQEDECEYASNTVK